MSDDLSGVFITPERAALVLRMIERAAEAGSLLSDEERAFVSRELLPSLEFWALLHRSQSRRKSPLRSAIY